MSPDASTLALASTEVDMSSLPEGGIMTVKWRGKPVFVRHRTAKEIKEAEATPVAQLPDPQTDAERVKNLAAEQPDMMVTLPGHDEPMRLADAMETARQEADRIRSDAELVRVAAACALENGATGLA